MKIGLSGARFSSLYFFIFIQAEANFESGGVHNLEAHL